MSAINELRSRSSDSHLDSASRGGGCGGAASPVSAGGVHPGVAQGPSNEVPARLKHCETMLSQPLDTVLAPVA